MDPFTELAARQMSAPVKAHIRAAEKRTAKREQVALAERDAMFGLWKRWRKERVKALLDGAHGGAARELLRFLKRMTFADAPALLALVQRGPWHEADSDTRFEVLSLVDSAIVRLRERSDLPPFDDPLPGAPPSVFLTLRGWLR